MKIRINQQQILGAFYRFPLTLLCSILATGIALFKIHDDKLELDSYILTAFVGIAVAFGIEAGFDKKISKLIQALGLVAVLALFYFYVAETSRGFGSGLVNYGNSKVLIAALIAHLFASYSPFITSDNRSFWSYNKHLFLNILTSFLYTVTLSIGLSLAILGVSNLFGFEVSYKTYLSMNVILNVFVNTLIFTSKLPELDNLDYSYPKGLKYFTWYVLLPLVSVYLLILFAYEIKIIANWELPVGWVSFMILASAVLGIFAFLLLYPIKDENKWIHKFSRLYYWLLLPLIVLLFVAIYTRINQYGFTELRFFVVVLAFWLLGIAIYFLRFDNIKIIPVSLSIVAFLATFGPFNAFNVSLKNQTESFNKVLLKYNLVKDNVIKYHPDTKIAKPDLDKLSASVEYLAKYAPGVLAEKVKGLDTESYYYNLMTVFYQKSGLPNTRNLEYETYQSYAIAESDQVVDIKGYDYFFEIAYYKEDISQQLGKDKVKMYLESDKAFFEFNGKEKLQIDLSKLTKEYKNRNKAEDLTFYGTSDKWDVKMTFKYLSVRKDEVTNVSAWVFVHKKE